MLDVLFWRPLARLLARPAVSAWLIDRAKRTPYEHLPGYMGRYWLFNPYDAENRRRWPWVPFSIRVHHILRADRERHLHDHPWRARTIILRGGYQEERICAPHPSGTDWHVNGDPVSLHGRGEGDTATLGPNQYHRIPFVVGMGVWTLFITYGRAGDWGFWVNGRKIPAREYFKIYGEK